MSYLRIYHPRPQARLRLVCLPHAGGAATAYRAWSEALPPWIELVCVQYPGRQDRIDEPLVADLPTLVDEVTAALPSGGRLALFGHSMGATVAFEVARRARPVHLFLSAPASGRTALHTATDEQLLSEVKRFGGSGTALLEHPEIRRLALPVIRHDMKMLAAHEIADGPPLTCPITALVGDADHTCPVEEAGGWATRTSAAFRLWVFAGGHHYLEGEAPRIVSLVAAQLERYSDGR